MKRIAFLTAIALVVFTTGCTESKALSIVDKPVEKARPSTSQVTDVSDEIVTCEQEETSRTDTVSEAEADIPEDMPPAEDKAEKPYDDLSGLEDIIYDQISYSGGDWSVYVQDLETGAELDINPMWHYPASLIKIYALAACYEEIEAGNIDEQSVYSDLVDMIEVSDNYAFNSIIWQLGAYYVTDWCNENGYEDTVQCHGLYPADNADGLQVYIGSGFNTTTAADCGRLLASMYRGECVSEYASQQMIGILSKQENRNKIPAGLPDGVEVANKTGETESECHDAAIVYSEGGDYVLVVMIETYYYDAYSYEYDIAELSKKVYDYFNNDTAV